MFDTVTCEATLPVREHQALELQTKNLECLLDHYEVTRDGHLNRKGRRWSNGPVRNVTWPHRGDLRFYTSTGEGEARQWIEYVARFSYGRLDWIRPHEEVAALEGEREPADLGGVLPRPQLSGDGGALCLSEAPAEPAPDRLRGAPGALWSALRSGPPV